MIVGGYPKLSEMYLTSTPNINNESQIKSLKVANSKGTPVRKEYYDTSGRRTNNPNKGIYLQRNTYKDGSSNTIKRMYR